jgi:hypothetical protein
MKKSPNFYLTSCFVAVALLLASITSKAQLNMIETDTLRLVTYDFGHKYILPHATQSFINSLRFHKKLFDYEPNEKITVLIQDFGDFGNGGATAIPRNAISMGLSPFSYTFETSPAGERVFSMMNHELVHVIALDNATKSDRFYQKLFMGKVMPTNEHPISSLYSFLTSPRRYSPRWYHEGIASYVETWMSGGVGLAMGSYDEMVFRTRVLEDAHIYSAQGLESEGTTTDFQGKSNSYLYGTRFFGYLANEYGPQKTIDWVKRSEGSKRFYSGQFKNVFGKSLPQGWSDWLAAERSWQQNNISKLKEEPTTEGTEVSDKVLGSVSYPYYDPDENKVYVAVNYPGKVPHIAALSLSTGELERLTDIKGAALFYVSSLVYDEKNKGIFYTTDNDAWRDLNYFDLKTRKSQLLQRDVRTGDMALNKTDESLWGIKHLNGYSTIVKIPKNDSLSTGQYSTWNQKHTLPYGQDIFDIDVSPDGTLLSAAVSDLVGNQSLILYDLIELENGVVKSDTIFNFEISSPQSFRFSEDGKYMYGCSYYSGVSNIFRVDLSNNSIEAMSNAITGFFRPIPLDNERLFAFRFTSDGFTPVILSNEPVDAVSSIDFLGNETIEKHPVLKDWELSMQDATAINLEDKITNEGNYKAGKLVGLNAAYPVILGYKNFIGTGYHFSFSDPLNFKSLDMTIAYTPSSWLNGLADESDPTNLVLDSDEEIHFSFSGHVRNYTLSGSYNAADFYDLFGPTKTSRKGINLHLNYNRSLVWDPPKRLDLNLGIGGFYGLEKSPEFQQINTAGFDGNLFMNTNAGLSYRNMKASLGAIDYEKGFKTGITLSNALTSGQFYPILSTNFDVGFQLPGNHFSLWVRNSGGISFSNSLNPFTRFGFAAFGNNYIDYRTARRYRGTFAYPGLSFSSDKAIIAKEFGKTMVELVFPPIRFKKFGALNFYSNWIQFMVFTSGLVTSDSITPNNRFVNFGSQMDMKIVIFSLLETTFSAGYARAYDTFDNNRSFDEVMISLKLLR